MKLKHKILVSIIIIFITAVFLSPFSSSLPDGLEYVAEKLGFAEKVSSPALNSPVPDYNFVFIKNEYISKALAGVLGVIVILLSGWGIERLMRRKKK
jgi:cobalt/nickel transport protein